jgi:hypothetical protein
VVGCESGALAESDNTVEWPFGCNVLVELVECISIALSRILFEVFEELIIRRKCVSDLFYKLAELLPSISNPTHQQPFQLGLCLRPSRKYDNLQDRIVEQLCDGLSRSGSLDSETLTHRSASQRSV